MKPILLVIHLLYPGESTFERVQEIPLASHQECRMAARILRTSYKAPEGFQYVTSCEDQNLSAAPAVGGMIMNYDRVDEPFLRVDPNPFDKE